MKTTVRKNERGFSLIIGMAVLFLMTMLGLAVIQTVNSDIDSAGSDKNAQSALAIAEAGVTWAIDYLQTQYQLNNATATTFQNIMTNQNGDLRAATSPSAEELSACPSTDACNGAQAWLIITPVQPNTPTKFGGGHFDVWVGLDPADASGKTLLLRSLGVDANNSQRLIEVAVAAGSGQTL